MTTMPPTILDIEHLFGYALVHTGDGPLRRWSSTQTEMPFVSQAPDTVAA